MGISYRLSDEHEQLRAAVAEFARDVVAPVIGGFYERREFPYEIVAKMGKLGLFGLPFPEEYGGMGGDYLAFCIALHELGRVDSSVAITLEAAVGLGAMPIYRFGSAQQRARWLPELCQGERLAAFGLTEPGGGPAIRREISAIVVPSGTEGFTVAPEYSKVGWCASDTRELAFASCRVPAENLLGQRGRGYAQFLQTLDEGRVAIAALSAGLAQGCVDECLRYVREREAFGHRLAYFQGIQFKIADMEARAHGARLGWLDAAARLVAGEPFKKQAAIAKLTASSAAMDNARDATQIFGGYGFMNEFPVARFYRDAKVLEIGEGTSEIQRMIIARELGIGGSADS